MKLVGKAYAKDENFETHTMVHELTHQMMHFWLGYLPQWVVEGTAEYTGTLPLHTGQFRVSGRQERAARLPCFPQKSDGERRARTLLTAWTNCFRSRTSTGTKSSRTIRALRTGSTSPHSCSSITSCTSMAKATGNFLPAIFEKSAKCANPWKTTGRPWTLLRSNRESM